MKKLLDRNGDLQARSRRNEDGWSDRLATLVLEMHDRDHPGVARWCDTQACREAWGELI